jgi:hypothetical protein
MDISLNAASTDKKLPNPVQWRALVYMTMIIACLLFPLAVRMSPQLALQSTADWQDKLQEAENAFRNRDLLSARSLYSQSARVAASNDDWAGILAAACGLKTIESETNSYFATRSVLVRAMTAAQKRQSELGLSAVAKAFDSIGEHNAATMARSRISADMPSASAEKSPQLWNCW